MAPPTSPAYTGGIFWKSRFGRAVMTNIEEMKIVQPVFFEELSSEFLNRTGFGPYAFVDPSEVHEMFMKYLDGRTALKDYVKASVKAILH